MIAPPDVPERGRVRRWGDMWVSRVKKYQCGYFAVAPTPNLMEGAPRCELVDHSISVVLNVGWRTYAFSSKRKRDAFVYSYPGVASVCENPIP